MNIQVHFTLNAAEYGNLMNYLVNWRRYGVIVAVALVFVIGQWFLIGVQAFAYLGLIIIFLGLFYFMIQRSVRKGFEMSPHLQQALTYQFTENGFQVRTEEVENDYTWDMFFKAREVPQWFLLHQNGGVYNYVPKRAFQSEAAIEEFRNFLQDKELLSTK